MREDSDSGVDEKHGLGSFYLRRSSISQFIDRKYVTFSDLVSYLGGIMQVLISIFGLVALYFNKTEQLITLANSLYTFINIEKRKNNGNNIIFKDRKSYYMYEFNHFLNKTFTIGITLKYVIYRLTC